MSLRRLAIAALALGLAGPAAAAPPRTGGRPRPPDAAKQPQSEAEIIDAALKAWAAGRWITVRSLLEPMVEGDRTLADPLLAETALRYLADATLLDESLDESIRNAQAAEYIGRLFAADPEWRPPPDTHGPKLYELYNRIREQQERQKLEVCLAERASCNADLDDLKVRHERLQGDHESLRRAFGEQEVEVREKVARNRAIALIPFGVGHFYNGKRALGVGFLAGEVVAGGAGLTLLIVRNTQCERTAGFSAGSLMCTTDNPEGLLLRRDAETGLGIAFLGLLVVDVILAQVTFQPYVTVKTERIRRQDLDTEPDPDPAGRRRRQTRARGTLRQARAYPTLFPGGGGGAGLSLRF